MRLLSTTDWGFREFLVSDRSSVRYAILSHCWSQEPGQEVTYQRAAAGEKPDGSYGWQKIQDCRRIALSRGHQWVWIDTCCIDKTSSAELSEAINSMYRWYASAAECYVFIDGISMDGIMNAEQHPYDDDRKWNAFRDCRWFTRGWTLQELLAPATVLFYDRHREYFGTRIILADQISKATGIPYSYLIGDSSIHAASVSQRMCWASKRETARSEDIAYSLLGIFEINMPLLYGEGTNAFIRLQLAIIEDSDDESIFAWGLGDAPHATGMLASSPRDFWIPRDYIVVRTARSAFAPPHRVTNRGIAFSRYNDILDTFLHVQARSRVVIRLACMVSTPSHSLLQISLIVELHQRSGKYHRSGLQYEDTDPVANMWYDYMGSHSLLYITTNAVELNKATAPTRIRSSPIISWCLRLMICITLLLQFEMVRDDSGPGALIAYIFVLRDWAPSAGFAWYSPLWLIARYAASDNGFGKMDLLVLAIKPYMYLVSAMWLATCQVALYKRWRY